MWKTVPQYTARPALFVRNPIHWLGVATFLVVLSLTVTAIGQSRSPVTAKTSPQFARSSSTDTVANGSGATPFATNVEAVAEPYRQASIASGAEVGIIQHIHVSQGDAATEGQLLVELDTDVLEASLTIAEYRSQMQGKIDAAKTEAQLRNSRLHKLRQLNAEGHATEGEIERAASDLAIAVAGVRMAQEEQQLYRLECERINAQIRRRQFRSPFDGIVAEIRRHEGETAMPNTDYVLTVVSLSPLRLTFSVPSDRSSRISAGQTVPILLPDVGDRVEGIVEVVSPVEDTKNGTVDVSVLVENQQNQFHIGMRGIWELP